MAAVIDKHCMFLDPFRLAPGRRKHNGRMFAYSKKELNASPITSESKEHNVCE